MVRTRLLDMIDRGVQGPLTVLSAPAGTGKTITAATWAASGRAPGPVVWLELGDLGTSVAGLWPAIIKALRRIGVWVRQKPADAVTGMYPGAIGELGAEIADHRDPVVLILDCDLDLPADTAAAIHHLLVAATGRLRLVLLSRADPLLPLHRYRLAQSVLEVRTADLAFTTAEARELLLRRGVDLPADVVESVNERTRGWAAGLLLAAMSMAGSRDPVRSAHDLSGAAGPIAEYLLAEVLEKQSPTVRAVLLRSSMVEVVQPGLAEVLAGSGGTRALAVLAHGSAFVDEVAGLPGWYRYHPLFRELLCAQFSYEAPDEARDLRLAAAGWYADNGMLDEAVTIAAAVGAWDVAARHIIDGLAVGALLDAHPGPLHEAAGQVPSDLPGAEAALVRAALALGRGQHAQCASELRCAQLGLEAGDAGCTDASAVVHAVLLTVLAAAGSGPRAALRAAVHADRVIAESPNARTASCPELARMVHRTRAAAALALGRLDEATEAYENVARGGSRPSGHDRDHIDALGHLALLASWRGKMRRAARLAHQALTVHAESGQRQDGSLAAAEVALGFIYAETQDVARAQRHIAEALEHGAGDGDAFVRVALALVRARLQRARGDLPAAGEALDGAGSTPPWLLDHVRVERARVELGAGRLARADDVLAGVTTPQNPAAELVRTEVRLRSGRPTGPADLPATLTRQGAPDLAERIDKRLVESQRRLRSGEQAGAIEALDRALRLAAPEHIRRPFLDAPVEIRRLLRCGDSRLTARHGWLAGERQPVAGDTDGEPRRVATDQHPATVSPMVVESLTAKEAEVLGHLAQLLTTEEIAAAMFVSVNTIRTHVRNILRKLSASRRNEAIRRARELGILPS